MFSSHQRNHISNLVYSDYYNLTGDVTRKLSDVEFSTICEYIQQEIDVIEHCFERQVRTFESEECEIRLLILAEAPLSSRKYIYNDSPGNFLSPIRQRYNLSKTPVELYSDMRRNGILVLDVYKYPIPSKLYTSNELFFNEGYLEDRFHRIRNLITSSTRVIFRYKKLYNRDQVLKKCIDVFGDRFVLENIGSLGAKSNSVILNEAVIDLLPDPIPMS